jgi:hypothetical protein
MTRDALADKRAQLAEQMKRRGRWDSSCDRVIQALPEDVLDQLLIRHSPGRPVRVG